eukprot:TRINITY_DN1883_c2_g1_i1.p1 TRINITY_DN1883_c2_g1~~TRINITY_DN1883_c2_g1_i1.p1  ORF type:complete len:514 (-),score=143.55 TRINITY_DN1883_c2_g1_i1:108-1649(-)
MGGERITNAQKQRNQRKNQLAKQALGDNTWVSVRSSGTNQINPPELIQFLQSKSAIPVKIIEGNIENGKVLLQTETPQMGQTVCRLSGIRYEGEKLIICFAKPVFKAINPTLEAFLDARINRERKFLNLGDAVGLPDSPDFTSIAHMRSMFHAIQQKFGNDVETVSLARNRITSLHPFETWWLYFQPSHLNVSFDGNQLSDFAELDMISKLPIKELELKNNPIRTQNSDTKYIDEVVSRFHKLKYLDGVKIDGPQLPIQNNFYENATTKQFAEDFLMKFCFAYDAESRDALKDAYSEQSRFSLTSFIPGRKLHPQDTVGTYRALNRNLHHIQDEDKAAKFLKIGGDEILSTLRGLPRTQHQLAESRVDSFLIKETGLLYIGFYGYFVEVVTQTKKAFSRNFLLTPVQSGSAAAAAGWGATVLSDQLNIRSYLGHLPHVTGSAAPAVPAAPAVTPQNPDATKEQMVNQLMQATKLKAEFAQQCLNDNAWQFDKAMQAFQGLATQGLIQPQMLNP